MRLLIVRLSAMGDVIHALPLAANARAAGATVGWVVERPLAGLLEGNPDCDRVFEAETKRWRKAPLEPSTFAAVSALRRALRLFAPDRTLDVQGLWKSAVIARAAGSRVAGFAAPERREPGSALLCHELVYPSVRARHVVDRNLALLETAGVPIVRRAPEARYLLARPSPEARAFLAEAPHPYAILHPGAGRPEKAWGEERFARLARSLAERAGLKPVISWGPGDEARLDRMAGLLPEAARLPPLDFAGLASVLSEAALVVAGDTGPLHLADALGARTLGLFGPTDPERNGPYRNPGGVVAAMGQASDQAVLDRALSVLAAAERPA